MNDLELILVHNHKGGTGKTMLAVHLAEHLARRGQKWCLWDADPQANAMSWVTGHRWQGEPSIRIPGENGRADLIATVDLEGMELPERLIADTPPAESLIENLSRRISLNERDLVVCPVNGRLAIDGAIKVAEEVAPTGCRVALVPNLTDPRDGHAREEIRAIEELTAVEGLNVEVFQLAIPRNEKYMREAELKGVPIWDLPYAERTHTAKALRAFCQWVAEGAPPEANRSGESGNGSEGRYAISEKLKNRLWNP